MRKVILNVKVWPPGFDSVQSVGTVIELPDDLAERYIKANYAFPSEAGAKPTKNVNAIAKRDKDDGE